jgi:hypothetical protein
MHTTPLDRPDKPDTQTDAKKSAVKTILFGVARHPYERIEDEEESKPTDGSVPRE